jgi:hypothetical protein
MSEVFFYSSARNCPGDLRGSFLKFSYLKLDSREMLLTLLALHATFYLTGLWGLSCDWHLCRIWQTGNKRVHWRILQGPLAILGA